MFLTLSNNKSKEERRYFPKATGNEAAGKEIFSWFGFNQINKLAWFKEKENEVKFVFVDTITTQQMLSSSFFFIYVWFRYVRADTSNQQINELYTLFLMRSFFLSLCWDAFTLYLSFGRHFLFPILPFYKIIMINKMLCIFRPPNALVCVCFLFFLVVSNWN